MWQTIVAPILGVVEGFQNRKARKDELESAVHQKRLELVAQGEIETRKSLAESWKDEYVTVVVTIPAIMAFCGDRGAEIVTAGFAALSTTPEWYQWLLLAVVSAAAGIPMARKAKDALS